MADMEKHRAWSSQTKKVKSNSPVCSFLTKLNPKNTFYLKTFALVKMCFTNFTNSKIEKVEETEITPHNFM